MTDIRNPIPAKFINPCRGIGILLCHGATYAAIYRELYGRPPHKRGGRNVYSSEEAAALIDWLFKPDRYPKGKFWKEDPISWKRMKVYARRVAMAAAAGRSYPSYRDLSVRNDMAEDRAWDRDFEVPA